MRVKTGRWKLSHRLRSLPAALFTHSHLSRQAETLSRVSERGRAMISLALGKTYGGLGGKKLLSLSLQAISCLESKINISVMLPYSNSERSLRTNTAVLSFVFCFFIMHNLESITITQRCAHKAQTTKQSFSCRQMDTHRFSYIVSLSQTHTHIYTHVHAQG